MRRVLIAALGGVAALVSTQASASLVYDPVTTQVSGQGFGSVPRSLTVHATGQNRTGVESGCIGVTSGGALTNGGTSCVADATVHDHNNYQNLGGDEENPIGFPKQASPLISDLGWTSATDVGILFNATDPAGDGVNLLDVTLKFFSSTGTLLGAIDGQQNFLSTEVGTGGAGFIFVVSSDEQTYINNLLTGGAYRVSLEASIGGAEGGSESFSIVNLKRPGAVPEPATWAMMLLGFGGIGMSMRRKQRRNGALMQVA